VDKVTIHTLKKLKLAGQKISMVTAYDATFARILDDAGTDVLLVGDSLGMVVQGNESTLPVTMDQMVYHCRAVSRGAKRAHVVGDLPFLSYQASVPEAVKNAGRLLAEGGVSSVKLEGGAEFAETIEAIVRAGIPVMGHLGLTPQSVHRMGGFVVQGREEEQARAIYRDAQALERAGCYALVLEGVPKELARDITASLRIPTIGIGAGIDCDGQVLVCYDLFGFNPDFKPKFVKRFADGYGVLRGAAEAFIAEVRGGKFPGDEYSFTSKTPLRVLPGQKAAASSPSGDEERAGPMYGVPV
jgi:3-methyl-2-oxobutanoate hydroxymethyltransferase